MLHFEFNISYFEIYLIFISILSFIIYGYDKALAIRSAKNISRVSENKLLLTSFIGGTIGSLLAMFIFRHKIKKPSFIIKFSLVTILQILFIYLYINKIWLDFLQ